MAAGPASLLFDELGRVLPGRLAGPLPGVEGQAAMAPRPRVGWRPGAVPAEARPSGVLLLLYPHAGSTHLLLTVRRDDLPTHAGQVSLPGGAVQGDESAEAAALREAREEVGVELERIRVVGGLTPLHVPVSGFVLNPYVGLSAGRPRLVPDGREVARLLEVSLELLADARTVRVEAETRDHERIEVPYFSVHGHRVWGATAMVLAEFLAVLGRTPSPPRLTADQRRP